QSSTGRDVERREEDACPPRVFGRNHVRIAQCFNRPGREIAEVAYGCPNQDEGQPLTSTTSPGSNFQRSNEPAGASIAKYERHTNRETRRRGSVFRCSTKP